VLGIAPSAGRVNEGAFTLEALESALPSSASVDQATIRQMAAKAVKTDAKATFIIEAYRGRRVG
jgi:hypothetical protein